MTLKFWHTNHRKSPLWRDDLLKGFGLSSYSIDFSLKSCTLHLLRLNIRIAYKDIDFVRLNRWALVEIFLKTRKAGTYESKGFELKSSANIIVLYTVFAKEILVQFKKNKVKVV